AAPGLGLGVAVHLKQAEIAIEEAGRGTAFEETALQGAMAAVKRGLNQAARKGGTQAAILSAHLAFLDDPDLIRQAEDGIARGKSAAAAWHDALDAQIAILNDLADVRLRERAADLTDLKRQVLIALGGGAQQIRPLPPDSILLADDILPSEM